MPLICKSSIAIDWFSLTSLEDSLCKKSLRWKAVFSCIFDNLFLVRTPLFLEYFLCVYFNFDSLFFKYLGLLTLSPLMIP